MVDARDPDLRGLTVAELRKVVHDEVERANLFGRLAYSVAEFAAATGYGRSTIDEAIARGDLVASYANKKGVIDVDEGRRWIKSLPHEPPK